MSETPTPPQRRTALQLIGATVGIIIMVFTGGCTLLLIQPAIGNDTEGIIGIALVVGGVPFLLGLLITYLSLRRAR